LVVERFHILRYVQFGVLLDEKKRIRRKYSIREILQMNINNTLNKDVPNGVKKQF